MITLADYFAGKGAYLGIDLAKQFANELTDSVKDNAVIVVSAANELLAEFGQDRTVNSGWRPREVNSRVPGAAVFSRHLTGEAIDLYDPEGDLDEWCLEHPEVLEKLDLWQEHPASTKGWCHVQVVAPKSGKRVFYP